MIWYLFGMILLGWALFYPLTDFYVRFLNPTTFRKDASPQGGVRLFLTFDDGPDPEITPQILKILAEFNIPACFFLVATKAERYPQIVLDILAAGHEIGLHTLEHRHAYLMFAQQSRASIDKGKTILERITGRPVFWFRPPWGAMNLFQYRMARQWRWPIVLWSANARDWKARTGQQGILQRLARKISNGAVVVLHDAGGESGAPQNTIGALPEFIKTSKAEGYQFCSLKDRGGRRMLGVTVLRRVSEAIDRRYLKKVGAITIPASSDGLVLVCYHPFEGKNVIRIPEGVEIRPHDSVAELHLSNIRITEIAREHEQSASGRPLEWRLMEILRSEFRLLAVACRAGLIPEDVKAFYGVNVMGAATKRLGFTQIPLPKGFNRWWLGFWESLLRKIYYSFQTSKKVTIQKTMNDPFEIWISRGELMRKYIKEEAAEGLK